jgi:ribose 5-phosphate isomerase B
MKIAIGNDHVGIELKQIIIEELTKRNIEIIDCGTDKSERTDYPIFAEKAANLVAEGLVDKGIVLCGSGVGISIAANKVNGIRCVCCSEAYSAKLSREHNDTNMLALGSRVVGKEVARMIVNTWLDSEFEGERHQGRIDLIREIEKKQTDNKISK